MALDPCVRDGQIPVEDSCYFREHMKDRHSNHTFVLRPLAPLANEFYIKEPIYFSLSFVILDTAWSTWSTFATWLPPR